MLNRHFDDEDGGLDDDDGDGDDDDDDDDDDDMLAAFHMATKYLALIWGKSVHKDIRYIVDIFTPQKKLEKCTHMTFSICDGSTEAESKRDIFVQIVIGTDY